MQHRQRRTRNFLRACDENLLEGYDGGVGDFAEPYPTVDRHCAWASTTAVRGRRIDVFFASGGFLEIQPGVVTVLADTALHADDIDEAAAQGAKEQAQRDIAEHAADFDYSRAMSQLAEATARERTLAELRKRRR